jgi:hypothetical protein
MYASHRPSDESIPAVSLASVRTKGNGSGWLLLIIGKARTSDFVFGSTGYFIKAMDGRCALRSVNGQSRDYSPLEI